MSHHGLPCWYELTSAEPTVRVMDVCTATAGRQAGQIVSKAVR